MIEQMIVTGGRLPRDPNYQNFPIDLTLLAVVTVPKSVVHFATAGRACFPRST
jgi:hypothetical protein